MRTQTIAVAGLATLLAAPLAAHHSISRHYRTNEDVGVEGVVVEVLLRNPHSQIRMAVGGDSADTAVWMLELDDIADLAKQGIVSGTLRAGDTIVVEGNSRQRRLELAVRAKAAPSLRRSGLRRRLSGFRLGRGRCAARHNSSFSDRRCATLRA